MKLRWNVASLWLKEFKNVYFNVTLVETNRIIRVFDLIIISCGKFERYIIKEF